MNPIRTILVPVDFRPSSEAALDEAVRYAHALGAEITLLHVQPFALSDVPEELFYPSANTSVRMRTSTLKRLSNLAESRRSAGVPIQVELREGIAWDEIIGAADRLNADLIVIGAHEDTGLTRRLLGNVADRVARTARVPVMTVRASVARERRTEYASR